MFVWCFFFFKQKTAYEMRISDWSSDVCSSDLSFCGLQRAAILADTAFDFRAEMLDQPLDRPCGGVAERTDGVAFDLLGDVEQSVDLADVGVAGAQPLHHARSEEHTSELQSLMRISYAVFCLKKKNYKITLFIDRYHHLI